MLAINTPLVRFLSALDKGKGGLSDTVGSLEDDQSSCVDGLSHAGTPRNRRNGKLPAPCQPPGSSRLRCARLSTSNLP